MGETSVTGKYILKGKLSLISPLLIGSGDKGGDIDIQVLKGADGKPYIPATSLAGALRRHFYQNADTKTAEQKQLIYFWGSDSDNHEAAACQSAFYLSDLTAAGDAVIKVRDGIKIDTATGIAEDEKKFDYEVVEPGLQFNFNAEVTIRKAYDKELFKKILAFITESLKKGRVFLGAMSAKGFGRCRLLDEHFYVLDFSNKQDVLDWLGDNINNKEDKLDLKDTFSTVNNSFIIDSYFEIKSSLIVKSYTSNPNAPDASHIECNGSPVLPGASIRGAIRGRATRIANTLGKPQELIKQLFGWVDDKGKKREKVRGKVFVEETPVTNVMPEIQSRIKIDRFTGGVQKGALFDSMPLWPVEPGKEMVRVRVEIKNYYDWEAGLMLLVLKDLWSGDLPLGGEKNIGRGVLKGIRASITFSNDTVEITAGSDERINVSGSAAKLEEFVQSFAG